MHRCKELFGRLLVLVVIAIGAALPSKGDAADARQVNFRTPIDPDGDGGTTTEELALPSPTDPNKFDSDPNVLMPGGFGDGFGDYVEAVNPGIANPLVPTLPDIGGALYQLGYTRWVTTGSLQAVISPAWSIRRDLAFIKANTNFTSGAIYIQDTSDLSLPSTGPLVSNLSPELREICFGPLGRTINYHRRIGNRDRILRVATTGGAQQLVLLDGTTSPSYSVRNPSIVFYLNANIQSGELETSGTMFLLGETDNPGASNGQLYAFELYTSGANAGRWDSSKPVRQVTNFTNPIARPKVSRNGKCIIFQEIRSDGKSQLYAYHQLDRILGGAALPYTLPHGSPADVRGEMISNDFTGGVSFPGGFGGSNNFVYYTRDINNVYNLNNPLSFTGSNFDLMCVAMGISGSRFDMLPPGVIRIPLPGNQFQIAPTRRGGSFAVVDDYLSDGVPGGNSNLIWAILESRIRVAFNNTGPLYKFTHPDGTEFTINPSTAMTGLTPENCLSISNLPSEVGTTTGTSIITALRNYLPHGTTFSDPATTGGMLGVISWEPEDLWTQAGILDETQARVLRYNVATGAGEDTLPWQQRNGRRITFSQSSFSAYGINAPVIVPVPVAAAKHWELY